MKLPTAKTPPKTNPTDYSILLFGPTKIGKTTFAAQAPDILFLACEPGLNALDAFQVKIESWAQLCEALGELAKGKHNYKMVCIDTVGAAYGFCLEHICNGLGISGPEERRPADVYGPINREFRRVFTKLASLPIGLLCIAHAKEMKIEERTGNYTKMVPALSNTPGIFLEGLMDVVLYAEMVTTADGDKLVEQRIIHTKPSANYSAGDRTGRLPASLPLNYSAFAEAFKTATKGKAK